MKAITRILLILVVGASLAACDSFLDSNPRGTIGDEQLNSPQNVEGLVTAAYSALGNDHWTVPFGNMWIYGDVRADNAHKGGGGTGDIWEYDDWEQYINQTDNPLGDRLWFRLYVGVSRANLALQKLSQLSAEEFPQKEQRIAEMRFVRGHFYFLLKILFKNVPYFDETVSEEEKAQASNVALSNQELWERIADEFRYAREHLPGTPEQVARADRQAATAYLAKTLLYAAYEQDEQHRVTNIDQDKLQEVVDLTGELMGQYALFGDFGMNFLWEYEDGDEIIFAVQRSINDGVDNSRVGMDVALNYPMQEFGCCWFNIPSQNLVNAFRTEGGVPAFDTFNDVSLVDSADFREHTVDPRLDHTVAIPSHPFKYRPDLIFDLSWTRTPQVYGPYTSMKELQQPGSPSVTAVGPFWASSKNTTIIRYADVLLWRAEALIELGRLNEALDLINQVRERAAASTDRLQYADGTPVSSYDVAPYQPGVNIDWTQETAREALRWERRLEFAMEGSRFFDLVRWGIADEVLGDFLDVAKQRRSFLAEASFTPGRDEYLPIPQQQIDFSDGVYEQNPGYN